MADEVIPANDIIFEELCNLLEQLHKKRKQRQDQDKILKNFFNEFQIKASEVVVKKNRSIFPILRLLVPKLDRERSSYNLQETKLGMLLVKISLCKESRDAQKLLNFRSVSNSPDNDFAAIASLILKNRLKPKKANEITVGDINNILDKIASAEVGRKTSTLDKIFSEAINDFSPVQLKWFLRFILKDLHLDMGSNRILALFHPGAPEYYETCGKLSKVCEDLGDGDAPMEYAIQLFLAISPMLSERLDVKYVTSQLSPDKTYQIENKFDGERFQVHMDNGRFEYFSRRGFSFTKNYGSTYDSGLLTPYLKDCFNSTVTSFILDGEMMGWHKEDQCFGSKGMNFDVKSITEKSKFRPCFCAFDILYFNGKSLVGPPEKGGLSLSKRLKILDKLFDNITGVIQHSERQIVAQSMIASEVLAALNKAIENQDEGIVVKDVESYYIPNRRNAGWYKIKPEYSDDAMTDLDLVIIGADEAENKKQGRAKSFVVACCDGGTPDEMPVRWVSVGRVSTGLTFQERERLCAVLENAWFRYKQEPAPPNLCFNKEKPDFWILPEHSVVVTVRASELIRSSAFAADYTLRFPRILEVRDDKSCKDIMTLEEYNRLCGNNRAVEKLGTKLINVDQLGLVKTRAKRKAQAPQVAEQFQIKRGTVEVTSKALLGRKIHILSEDEDCTRTELSKIIESHGGIVVASTGSDTWCCVAGRKTYRVSSIAKMQAADVISTAWLRSLPPASAPVPLAPLHMLAVKPATRLALSRHYDAFGDSYTEVIDEETLKKCFEKMDSDQVPIYLTTQEMLNLDIEIFDEKIPFSFLRPCTIYFAMECGITPMIAKMYGAAVYDVPDSNCTHIVVPNSIVKNELNDLRKQSNASIVRVDWLETCFSRKELVPDTEFLVI